MKQDSPLDLAFQFVEFINRRDLDGLAALMADDHVFIDLSGDEHRARDAMIEGWRSYFSQYPHYMIHLAEAFVQGEIVVLVGRTTGSHTGQPRHEEFQGTVIWVAETHKGKLKRWQLVKDTLQNRASLALDSAQRFA